MEWFTNIASSLTGMPWYGVAAIVVLSIACTKGVDGLLKLRRSRLEERQYEDGQAKAGYEALIAELKGRVDKLESVVEKLGDKLDAANAKAAASDVAHAKCETEQERLRGELNVVKVELDRLKAHDVANKEQVQQTQADLAKVAETVAKHTEPT